MTARFDLAAYREQQAAERAEADEETFSVFLGQTKDEFGEIIDETVEIPALRYWPIKAQVLLSDADIVGGITLLAGPEQAVMFDRYNWTFGEFEMLFTQLAKWAGFKMGQTSLVPPVPGSTQTRN